MPCIQSQIPFLVSAITRLPAVNRGDHDLRWLSWLSSDLNATDAAQFVCIVLSEPNKDDMCMLKLKKHFN